MSEILLVEDSETDAALLKRTLKGAKVTNPVRCVSDGSEAMASLREMEPKAVQIAGAIHTSPNAPAEQPTTGGFQGGGGDFVSLATTQAQAQVPAILVIAAQASTIA